MKRTIRDQYTPKARCVVVSDTGVDVSLEASTDEAKQWLLFNPERARRLAAALIAAAAAAEKSKEGKRLNGTR